MKKYTFKPYSNAFPILFNQERERLASHLPQESTIEHVGSTSVPNLGGKGIIDIAIAINKLEMDNVKSILENLGYEFHHTFSTPSRFFFVINLPDQEEEIRKYHVHLTDTSSKEWKELIGFRDYLRAYPEVMKEYSNIKQQAAGQANQDGAHYRKMKEPIIQKIMHILKNKP